MRVLETTSSGHLIDFKKAFDSINRDYMFAILRHYGIPEETVLAIRLLYNNSRSAVIVNGNMSDVFEITTGVLQGDVLTPFLFVIIIDFLMITASRSCDSGLTTHNRQSRRLPAVTLNDLDFR